MIAPEVDGDLMLSEREVRAIARKALAEDATGYQFFQAVRLLSRLLPERARLGEWADPVDEVIRITVPPSLAFPPSEVAEIVFPETDQARPVRVDVRFMGLTGPQGVLPHVYTEQASSRSRARDTAFRDFLDLFHHRAISLLYRAWERHQFVVSSENKGDDRLLGHLLDLCGFGTDGLRHRSGLADESIAFYSGLLALRTRPAVGMAQFVTDYFGVPASVEQFVGEWRTMTGGGQFDVGADGDDARLGFGVVGNAVWDPQSKVRLRLGPLTRAQFDGFLPGGAAHEPLRALARVYADAQVGVEAQLVLARKEVPGCILGATDSPALGLGTWLHVRPMTRDPDDAKFVLT